MQAIRRTITLWLLGAVCASQAASVLGNFITVVVSDGPLAGTYTAEHTACLHVKDRNTLGCGWKQFAEHPRTTTLEEAGIQIHTVSRGPGVSTGDVIIKFLDGVGQTMRDYTIHNVPLTLTRNGSIQEISFDGKTKDGVRMKVTGTIVQVDEF